jgi:trypsin
MAVKVVSSLAFACVVGAARVKNSRSLSTCGVKGSRGPTGQIVGGEDATECEWNWQVGLMDKEFGKPWCGGMLISDEWAVTAAHCCESSTFVVSAGDYNHRVRSGKEQFRNADRVITHPGYNPNTMANDIALVKVDRAFTLGGCIGTVCLPTEDIAPGSECWISGWGTLESGGSQPNIMQEAAVNIISNKECVSESYYSSSEILPSMLCAQGGNKSTGFKDACQGDSGGPLVCADASGTWRLHGATSWGYGCADKNYPGVWARVAKFVNWIDETIGGKGDSGAQPVTCPSFSAGLYPDKYGDCDCPSSTVCMYEGERNNCPSADGQGAWLLWFSANCTGCTCE